ncbi:hypothetical protein [Fibrella forsythiae]|uniref:Uncharacterized protein n=1 Tax=Fibrella forsythiae TaxID=2817061 RepID=A0ABS3JBE8_9BACT|nr:hypothetical protein [Fibrella forsythiae]MBO0947307.1 hypothetical protein [Fibrella forsythiae]
MRQLVIDSDELGQDDGEMQRLELTFDGEEESPFTCYVGGSLSVEPENKEFIQLSISEATELRDFLSSCLDSPALPKPSTKVTVTVYLDDDPVVGLLSAIDCKVEFDLPFYPAVGDKIRIMAKGEPIPDWIRCSEALWEKINAGGIILTGRTIDVSTVDYDGQLW